MDAARFDYHLPPEHIAQEPAPRRDAARLMVIDRASQRVTHTTFDHLGEYLPNETRCFRNNAAVLKARLHGQRATGGKVECLLLHPAEDPQTWWCLLKPGKKTLAAGHFGLDGFYAAKVLEAGNNGNYRVRFQTANNESVTTLAERIGIMPLPPYIERSPDGPRQASDNDRYQTVYADYSKQQAVAAPTAGLHFTPQLIQQLEQNGTTFHDLTLQVGIGTFHPIQVDDIREHPIHHEWYTIPAESLAALENPAAGPRLAVGTTSVRSMEDALLRLHENPDAPRLPDGSFQAEADIFIYPPATFRGVDHLITNFHLPKSTLLCLVSAFLTPGSADGIDWLHQLYQAAIQEKYRFYSYGDAMLIL
ncbi:MAG: tRNA preQ1(34) S-adenosylmethionine ribosyltransferase-isomerase QueA [Verrucomicrobia bacterium]|nr:tRNA preQ1(34) S-adenosylmethionine ribosyltransferase-isomerase QueA [Verrucomicrobiota bacterium]